MRDDSAEILFQSFLQEAIVGSSGMDRGVHSLSGVDEEKKINLKLTKNGAFFIGARTEGELRLAVM